MSGGGSERQVGSIISASTMDEASMWVKDPTTKEERDSGLRREGSRTNDKLGKRGSNIHLAVRNGNEDLFTRQTDDDGVKI